MKRYLTSATMLLMGMVAFSQTMVTSPIEPGCQLEALGMSANGRYVCGLNVETYRAFIWDTESSEISENEGDYVNSDFRSVTNDGVAYGILGGEDMVTTYASKFSTDGAVTYIDGEMTQVFDVTPDGSVAVGCLLDEMWQPTPCIWKDGKRQLLPAPSQKECGIDNGGANALFVSDDGTVIAGYLLDWRNARPAVVWRQQADGTYAADVVSKDVWEPAYGDSKPYMRFEALGLSANGKWLCLSATKEGKGFMPTPEFMVRMNLESGEIIESAEALCDFYDPAKDNCYPTAIADDGTCVGVIQSETGRLGMLWMAEETAPRLMSEVFPEATRLEDYDVYLHNPLAISADALTIVGYGMPMVDTEFGLEPLYESYKLTLAATDGITTLRPATTLSAGKIYNLQGQQVSQQGAKGLLIVDGKKVVR